MSSVIWTVFHIIVHLAELFRTRLRGGVNSPNFVTFFFATPLQPAWIAESIET